MARRTISFDGTSLQSTTIKTRQILHESLDNRELNIQRLGKGDGGKLVSETFAPRTIRLYGTIVGTSIDNLESNIDNIKELFNRQEKDLDIAYNSGTRRYKASCRTYTIEREHFNITYANWEAEFVCSNPCFGQAIDTSTAENELVQTGTGTVAGMWTFAGTRRPMPIIQATVNAEVLLTKMTFRNVNTDTSIAVEEDFAAADVLRINTADYTVTLNGNAHDYTGSFPEFVVGGNTVNVELRCTTANVSVRYIYYPLFL